MNIPQDTLNAWRRSLDTIRGTLNALRFDIASGRITQAQDKLQTAEDATRTLGLRMEQEGAERPSYQVQRNEIPLELLDTPTNRRYRDALREAWEAGLAVDRERYGDSIGTDGCAQIIEMVLADVEAEITGPQGTGE